MSFVLDLAMSLQGDLRADLLGTDASGSPRRNGRAGGSEEGERESAAAMAFGPGPRRYND